VICTATASRAFYGINCGSSLNPIQDQVRASNPFYIGSPAHPDPSLVSNGLLVGIFQAICGTFSVLSVAGGTRFALYLTTLPLDLVGTCSIDSFVYYTLVNNPILAQIRQILVEFCPLNITAAICDWRYLSSTDHKVSGYVYRVPSHIQSHSISPLCYCRTTGDIHFLD